MIFALFIALILLLIYLSSQYKNINKLLNEINQLKYRNDVLTEENSSLKTKLNKLEKENNKIKEINDDLSEHSMSPAQLREKRARKKRAESYKLWSENLERDLRTGSTKFQWQTMNDARVCDECRKLNGKMFYRKDLAKLRKFVRQHKGEDGCRCYLDSY